MILYQFCPSLLPYMDLGFSVIGAHIYAWHICPQIPASSTMTLNKGDKLRNMDKRRGSMPFPMNLPNLHRRSMPVDDRDLCATMPQTGQTDELSNLLRCTSYSPNEQHRGSCASDSSDSVISTGSEAESQVYKVVLLGEHGVGKSSLARVFGGVEDAGHDCDEAGKWWCCGWVINHGKPHRLHMRALKMTVVDTQQTIKLSGYHRILNFMRNK